MNDGKSWLEVLRKTPITELDVGTVSFRRRASGRGFKSLTDLFKCSESQLDSIFDYRDVDTIAELKVAYRTDPNGFAKTILGKGTGAVLSDLRKNVDHISLDATFQEGEDWVIDELIKLGLNYLDKRALGGCLWVVGGKEISEKIKSLIPYGAKFVYSEKGGRVTHNKPSWWMSGYPEKTTSNIKPFPKAVDNNMGEQETSDSRQADAARLSNGKKIAEQTRDVLKVLADAGEACTYSFLSFELPQYDYDELADIIDLLKMQHLVSEGQNGIELIRVDTATEAFGADVALEATGEEIDISEAEYVTEAVIKELAWNSRLKADDSVSVIDLPTRTYSALKGVAVDTIFELVVALANGTVRGLGEKSINEIQVELEKRALPLGGAFARCAEVFSQGDKYKGFCFDPFGVLCFAETKQQDKTVASYDAVKLAMNTEQSLKRKGYPIRQGSFEHLGLCFDKISQISEASERESAIKDLFDEPNGIQRACEIELIRQLKGQAETVVLGVAANDISVPGTNIWKRAAIEVTRERRWCSYDAKTKTISFIYPRLISWLNSFEFEERKVLKARFLNRPFKRCAEDTRFDAIEAQKVFQDAMKSRPYFNEDRYRHFVSTYIMTSEQFASVTGEGVRVLNYLRLYPCKDAVPSKPIIRAVNDDQVPIEVRRIIANLTDLGSIDIDGDYVHLDAQSIVSHITRKHASSECISLMELIDLYRAFLRDNEIPPDATTVAVTSSKEMRKVLDGCMDILVSSRPGADKVIRYYEYAGKRFAQLTKVFTGAKLRNCECSTLVMFSDPDNSELMQEFDVRDEYELHSIVKKYCAASRGWSLGKSPMVTIGKADRVRQVRNLIKELSPATEQVIAYEYEKLYGVKQSSFKAGGYLKPFKAYERNGKYIYSSEKLPKAQQEYLAGMLVDDYHSLTLVRARFRDKYPNASVSAINDFSVKPLGYRISENLLVREEVDERKLFAELIDSKDSFTEEDERFSRDIITHPAFKSEMNTRLKSYDLFEWEPGSFIAARRLYASFNNQYRKRDIESYVEHAYYFLPERTPFTVFSLRKNGFTHKIDKLRDELGFEDFFYDGILIQGKQNTTMKSTQFGKVSVFCRTPDSFSGADLIEYIVGKEKAIEVDDLVDLLLSEYNVQTTAFIIRNLKTELYYNDLMDMLFDGLEAFKEYSRSVL